MRKNTKTKIIAMCTALTLLAGMTGCGKSDEASKSGNTTEASSEAAIDTSEEATSDANNSADSTSAQEEQETSENEVSYATTEMTFDENGNPVWNYIDDVVLNDEVYKDDNITVTITRFAVEYDDLYESAMANVYAKIENNTNESISVYLTKYDINGIRMMSGWITGITNYPTVSNVTEDSMQLDGGSFYYGSGLNFNEIETITFEINIVDDDTLEPITDPIPYEIKVK
ncbi:MAG: hypothetical protein ACI4EF_09615 [Coprococcus sp.]